MATLLQGGTMLHNRGGGVVQTHSRFSIQSSTLLIRALLLPEFSVKAGIILVISCTLCAHVVVYDVQLLIFLIPL